MSCPSLAFTFAYSFKYTTTILKYSGVDLDILTSHFKWYVLRSTLKRTLLCHAFGIRRLWVGNKFDPRRAASTALLGILLLGRSLLRTIPRTCALLSNWPWPRYPLKLLNSFGLTAHILSPIHGRSSEIYRPGPLRKCVPWALELCKMGRW